MKGSMNWLLAILLVVVTLFFITLLYKSITARMDAGISSIKAPVGMILFRAGRLFK